MRCTCPQYFVPSADPNDAAGCPLHDPEGYKEIGRALQSENLRLANLEVIVIRARTLAQDVLGMETYEEIIKNDAKDLLGRITTHEAIHGDLT